MSLIFCRLGGLSPVKYKKKSNFSEFHSPPRTKGIYAFPWPYIEIFLVAWKKDFKHELESNGFRKFTFDGYLWCHFQELAPEGAIHCGSWVKVHVDDYKKMFQKAMIRDASYLMGGCDARKWGEFELDRIVDDPYKRGRGGHFSRDHLEIFIEKSEMGKIR